MNALDRLKIGPILLASLIKVILDADGCVSTFLLFVLLRQKSVVYM